MSLDKAAPVGLYVAIQAGSSALITATVFKGIHPLGGALFGGVRAVLQAVLTNYSLFDNSQMGKVTEFFLDFFACLSVGVLCTVVGFPISFTASILLSLAIIPLAIAITHLCGAVGLLTQSDVQKQQSIILNLV